MLYRIIPLLSILLVHADAYSMFRARQLCAYGSALAGSIATYTYATHTKTKIHTPHMQSPMQLLPTSGTDINYFGERKYKKKDTDDDGYVTYQSPDANNNGSAEVDNDGYIVFRSQDDQQKKEQDTWRKVLHDTLRKQIDTTIATDPVLKRILQPDDIELFDYYGLPPSLFNDSPAYLTTRVEPTWSPIATWAFPKSFLPKRHVVVYSSGLGRIGNDPASAQTTLQAIVCHELGHLDQHHTVFPCEGEKGSKFLTEFWPDTFATCQRTACPESALGCWKLQKKATAHMAALEKFFGNDPVIETPPDFSEEKRLAEKQHVVCKRSHPLNKDRIRLLGVQKECLTAAGTLTQEQMRTLVCWLSIPVHKKYGYPIAADQEMYANETEIAKLPQVVRDIVTTHMQQPDSL